MVEGTVNQAFVFPREIVREVIINNATSVILAHTHTSGTTKPSNADIHVISKMKEEINTIEVNLTDHIIVAEGKYISMAEQCKL